MNDLKNDASELPPQRGPLPPVYFLLAIVGMIALHRYTPVAHWLDWPWRWLGLAPLVTGVGLAILANRQFARHGTTVKPHGPSSAVVTDGAFSLSRNPMYFGMLLVLTGEWILLGSMSPVVIIPLHAVIMTKLFIEMEETKMERLLGQEYLDYKSRVRRWI